MTSAIATERATAGAAACTSVVRAVGLGKTIEDRPILRDINIDVPPGSYLALLGANGAGKSTLLRILATLTRATSGHLELFGQPVRGDAAAIRARIGMIGHQLMLYRDLSARENLELFGRLYGMRHARRQAMELLEFVGLADRAEDAVKRLSRGMSQRVAIARALMHSPELLLADEPFTGLDAPSVRLVEQRLADLHAGGTTIILTNHDIARSLEIANTVVLLRGGRVVLARPAAGLDASSVLAAATGVPGDIR